MPAIHHFWPSVIDCVNGALSVFKLDPFLRLSVSHGCGEVLQWWSGERASLTEGSQALPPAVDQHWTVLQRGADRWACNGMMMMTMMILMKWRCRGRGQESKCEECEMYEMCSRKISRTSSPFINASILSSFLLLSAAGCDSLKAEQKEVLLWLFRPPLQAEPLSEKPNLTEGSGEKLVEIGPRYCWFCPTQYILFLFSAKLGVW